MITALGTLGGKESWPSAINERGHVVGWSNIKARGTEGQQAFLWRSGKMRDLSRSVTLVVDRVGLALQAAEGAEVEHASLALAQHLRPLAGL